MVFWIGILVAAVFAFSCIKLGFYQAWSMLFNLLIAVYLAIRLGPTVQELVPMEGPYTKSVAVLATGVGAFLLLHGISYVFMIGQFEVTFPRALNVLGAGLFGFLAGFLVCSFATLVIYTTPFCENQFVRDIGFGPKGFEEAGMQSYMAFWCNIVDKFAATKGGQTGTETIRDLLTKPAKGVSHRPHLGAAPDVNEPNDTRLPTYPTIGPAPDSNVALPP
jgi:hypothetical protein